ncbi:MAG: PKD domain-containing protein [Ferruginibacter sp.]
MRLKLINWFPGFILFAILFLLNIKVAAQLSANFNTDNTAGCSPVVINFTNISTGTSEATTYLWDFGNGNTSTIKNPGAVYSTEGTYNITLTVKEGAAVSSKTQAITVYGNPDADFSISKTRGCVPLATNFTANATSSNITSYYWDFGDGNTQRVNTTAVNHTYTVVQSISVSLTVTNSYGCSKTVKKEKIIEALPGITTSFDADKTALCKQGETVRFSNTTTGAGTISYNWDFGDGSNSGATAPQHQYQKAGTYAVSLTATSSEGCSITVTKDSFIRVANFNSGFDLPPVSCDKTEYTIRNTTDPVPNASSWYINGNNLHSPDSSFLKYTFPATGTYEIKLLNSIGNCKDSAVKTIIVKSNPSLNGFLESIDGSCGAPVKVNFQDTTAGAVKWQWNFNSLIDSGVVHSTLQAPSYTFSANGNYVVNLKIETAEGCAATISKTLNIAKPSIIIKADNEPAKCGPYSISYSAVTTENITAYKWDFGDGGVSADPNPTHFFGTDGNYTVVLTYTLESGCTDTTHSMVYMVYKQPTASFTAASTTICGNNPVNFSAVPQESVSYNWFWGDESVATGGPNNVHQYNKDSVFSVRLIVVNPAGCADTMDRNQYITVLPPFIKKLNYKTNCTDRGTVTLMQESSKGTSWSWDFRDGTTMQYNTDEASITHEYKQSAIYKPILAVTNGNCTIRDTVRLGILLKQNPALTVSKTTVCNNEELSFSLGSLEKNPMVAESLNYYKFDKIEYADQSLFTGVLKDTSIAGGFIATAFAGSFTNFEKDKTGLRIITKSAIFGCFDTTNIIPLDVKWSDAIYNVTTPTCFKSETIFTDLSGTNNQLMQHLWDFGDGQTLSANNGGTITHKYDTPGIYSVKLTVKDANNCSYTSAKDVLINGPKAAFDLPSTTFITLPVNVVNKTITFDSINTKYRWDFGTGATSSAYSPTYVYNTPGEYDVSVIAANVAVGCTDTAIHRISVNDFRAAFDMESAFLGPNNCLPVLVKLTNKSINYTSVKWDFGDENSADNLNTPSHIYVLPGKYTITLHAFGPQGLVAVYTDSILVKGPEADLSVDKKEICKGQSVNFTALPGNSTVSFTWDLGDGTLVPSSNRIITHQYLAAGKIIPYLIVYDSAGCKAPYSLKDGITVREDPAVSFFPEPAVVCRNGTIDVTASGAATYQWTPAEGLDRVDGATATVSPLINTTYSLKATDDIGCTNNASVLVNVIQPLSITVVQPAAQCLGKDITLKVTGGARYQWIGNTTGIANINSGETTVVPPATGNHTYTVTGTDANECFSDTTQITVTSLPLPAVNINPVGEIVFGSGVTLNAITDADVVQWQWSPSKYLSCTSCPSPVSTPMEPMNYKLTVTNRNGCSFSGNVSIAFQCKEAVVMIPGAFSPNNDGLNDYFMIRGIATVNWLQIYNRMGNLVFEKRNFNAGDNANGWDGYYKGNPADPGTYVYFAEIKCPGGSAFIKKGTITLTR